MLPLHFMRGRLTNAGMAAISRLFAWEQTSCGNNKADDDDDDDDNDNDECAGTFTDGAVVAASTAPLCTTIHPSACEVAPQDVCPGLNPAAQFAGSLPTTFATRSPVPSSSGLRFNGHVRSDISPVAATYDEWRRLSSANRRFRRDRDARDTAL